MVTLGVGTRRRVKKDIAYSLENRVEAMNF